LSQWRYVNLPKNLVEEIEEYIRKTGRYSTVSDFVKEAVRLRLESLSVLKPTKEAARRD